MIGNAELARLAELLELSSETARAIAQARGMHQDEISILADQICSVAIRLGEIARTSERTKAESSGRA